MTKKDLFKIILKLYGLFSIVEVLVQIPNISYYIYLDSSEELNWLMLLVPLISLVVVSVLLFKPEIVIQLFRLDKGFDNNSISPNTFDGAGITKIALIFIAVYLIASNLGAFVTQVLFSFKSSVSQNNLDILLKGYSPNPLNYQVMISTGSSILIGFILLTNHTRLTKWIEKINTKNAE